MSKIHIQEGATHRDNSEGFMGDDIWAKFQRWIEEESMENTASIDTTCPESWTWEDMACLRKHVVYKDM